MLTMQIFHSKLFPKKAEHSEYFKRLAQLTQISLSQVKAIKSNISWDIWRSTAD
jgi:hypothetical protein